MSNYLTLTQWHEEPGGFLYYPRDINGNYFVSAKTGNYPQINLIKTDKNGFVRIKEDVNKVTDFIYWTNNSKVIPNKIKNGRLFLNDPSGTIKYCFDNGEHYLAIQIFNGAARFMVWSYDGVNLQNIDIPNFLGFRTIQANKSATELLLIGSLADAAPPFAFNPADYTYGNVYPPGDTPTDFYNRLKTHWEAIARYSIVKTGNPAAPYSLVNISYSEQWRGVAFQRTSTPPTPPEVLFTQSCGFTYNGSVVINAYYDSDTYHEIVFTNASASCAANIFSWAFAVDGVPCSYAVELLQDYGSEIPSVTGVSLDIHYLDEFFVYSNLKPSWAAVGDGVSGTVAYSINDSSGLINPPAKTTPTILITDLYNSFDRARYLDPGTGVDTLETMYFDPVGAVINKLTYQFTDKFNNHFVLYIDDNNIGFNSIGPAKALVTNTALGNVVDLSAHISGFFAADFLGVI